MTARELAFRVLMEPSRQDAPELKDRLDAAFRRHRLPPEDRPLAAELVYGVTRWRRRLDAAIDALASDPSRVSAKARQALRLGVYQLQFVEKIPPHAAVYETVALAKREGVPAGFVNGVLRRLQREGDPVRLPDREADPAGHLALKYSYPDWLVLRWVKAFGVEEAEALCRAHNEPPPLSLRVNLLRGTRAELIAALRKAGAEAREGVYCETAVHANHPPSLAEFPPFREGRFTAQDESSQLTVALLDPKEGESALDLCAAPGGKTTAIAERMRGWGTVLARDVSEEGLRRVRANAKRLGLAGIEIQEGDARDSIPEWIDRADRVLVDAPCSALGVLRRHADARWRKSADAPASLAAAQSAILRNAARHVRLGGVLVYGVCTDTPEETRGVAAKFLKERPEFVVEPASGLLPNLPADAADDLGAMRLVPHRHGTDGFYAIRFRRVR